MNLRCKFHLTANLSICALFFLTLSMSSLSLAAHVSDRHRMVLHVCKQGCRFERIQMAVDAARSGDTIQIGPGTYFENVDINNKDLTVQGASSNQTTVDGRFRGPVFSILPLPFGTGSQIVSLSGLTITHGRNDTGGGIMVAGTVLTVTDSAIVSNWATQSGGGIDALLEGTADASTSFRSLIIQRCLIARNRALSGGGLHTQSEVHSLISNSSLVGNHAEAGGGAFIEYATRSRIENTTISDNTADGDGGGIWVAAGGEGEPASMVTFSHDAVVNNQAALSGGGIFSSCLGGHCIVLEGENSVTLNISGSTPGD